MNSLFVGDVGTKLVLNCGVDVSTGTTFKVLAKPPTGPVREWVASLEGVDSIAYTTIDGDFNLPGLWKLQSYVEMPGWKGRGLWAELTVEK